MVSVLYIYGEKTVIFTINNTFSLYISIYQEITQSAINVSLLLHQTFGIQLPSLLLPREKEHLGLARCSKGLVDSSAIFPPGKEGW